MPKIDIGPMDVRLGTYIRECRESRHLSQPMIARVLDIDQQQLSRYEMGLNRLPLYLGAILADVLGQSVDHLVSASKLLGEAAPEFDETQAPYRWKADESPVLFLSRLQDATDRKLILKYFNRLKRRSGVRQPIPMAASAISPAEIRDPILQRYFSDYFCALERYSALRPPEG